MSNDVYGATRGVKQIGFLSFGHWTPAPYSDVRTASNALLQSIELAVAAEELGLDGAWWGSLRNSAGADRELLDAEDLQLRRHERQAGLL